MRLRGSPLACGLVFALPGCSWTGVGDFDIGTCSEREIDGRSPCEVLDERDGIPENACYHWQCRSTGRGCELRPRDYDDDGHADEQRCTGEVEEAGDCDDEDASRHRRHREESDGVDNDCDDIVDNQPMPPCMEAVEAMDVDLPGTRGELELQRVAGPTDFLLTVTRNGQAALVDPTRRTSTPFMFDSLVETDPPSIKRCPTPGGNQACNFRELALASVGDSLIGAALSDNAGCTQGEIRVGVGRVAETPISLWLGSSERHDSNVDSAIDRTEEHCPKSGARRPAIVGRSDAAGVQALTVWLEGDPHGATFCGEAVGVRGIGLWVIPADPAVVLATGGGNSQEIGRSRGGAAPAVIADVDGYIAAFGNSDGDLELRFLEALASATQAATTSALHVSEPHRFMEGRGVDFVALHFAGTNTRIGAAFRTDCSERAKIHAVVLGVESGTPRVSGLNLIAEVELDSPTEATVLDGPHLVYVPSGFQWSEGAETSRGGWLVSWIVRVDDMTRLLAARISEDGELLDRSPFQVAWGVFDQIVGFGAGDGRVSYVGSIAVRDTLGSTTMFCGDNFRVRK